ncbi:os07g0295200 protein, related [Neospora caninum Liverpool]|uniref:Os07g0295200 protein, related n=1 Tax=Neospora caninum (strain Liverpool) TaxID=572307 RepID=F0V8N6_NEOCL|nr:os07g0295200 protein, related [Neospora caninum Liverpool]CBZ50077.1 os07g0295200 protein, related [Neospora caninum Liverpool]CEL64671.1 TPA: Os07g0295200 protein, related [Neospora caninum Liverpool]|eukprot:XP_003880112.1 os07g0295200 protein, related [Neospora caninum Liverpool]
MPINPEGGFETELERDLRINRKRYASRVYTNANKFLLDEKFRVFHCKRCTSHVLITDADVDAAPRRRTDNAPVFCPDKNLVKLRTKPIAEPVKVKRLKGLETQYLHACAECGQHVAYQSVPHDKGQSVPFVYIIETAVIFPKKAFKPRLRCRVCGFIPRNEQHFEDHKRERGHWDQDSGNFPATEEPNDAPLNPIIVG